MKGTAEECRCAAIEDWAVSRREERKAMTKAVRMQSRERYKALVAEMDAIILRPR